MTKRFTEGEITSLVRRFFRANDFEFLSTSFSGEKLYYTLLENGMSNKQPDSIVRKDDLVILCEDKILFSKLFTLGGNRGNDYTKLTSFLSSAQNMEVFKKKLPISVPANDIKLIGCLSSLASKLIISPAFISDTLINLAITTSDSSCYKVKLHCSQTLSKYFTIHEIEFQL